MHSSESSVATAHASKYLQQLCKHWSHRFAVTFDARAGRIDFGEFGDGVVLHLTARPSDLRLLLEAPRPEGLDRFEAVVANHLKRFAFREELAFVWTRPG